MPPKGTPKKAAPEPKTAVKATPKATPKKVTAKADTPKKSKEAAKTTPLDHSGSTVPVNVSFQGELAQAKLIKSGMYVHQLKLEASASFSLVKTYTITEGDNEGQQVIVLEPAKAFPFPKLSPELRARVYKYYFASKGVVNNPVVFGDGKRKDSGDGYAKSYASGNKFRVAILAVNKSIHTESIQIFYAQTIRVENTNTLMDFLAITSSINKLFLRRIEVKAYQKSNARNSLAFLAEAKNLTYLKFDVTVSGESDVGKAAKVFWTDAHKLLEAVGARLEKQMVDEAQFAQVVSVADSEEDEEAEDEDAEEDEEEQSSSDNDAGQDSESESEKAPKKSDASDTATTDASGEKAEVTKTQPGGVVDANAEAAKPITTEEKRQDVTMAGHTDTVSTIPTVDKSYITAATAWQEKLATELNQPKQPKGAQRQGRKSDAIAIIKFGKDALKHKNKKGELVNWDANMVAQLRESLRAKLK